MATEKEREKTLFHKAILYVRGKNKNNKIFIVHRLDRETSGIVVFAKSEKIKYLLQENWDKITKMRGYVAITERIPEKEEATLKDWLKENRDFKVYVSEHPHDGKLAITKYKVLKKLKRNAFLELNLVTGRKNQIRVQLSNINAPIIGDKKYEAKTDPLRRLGLHAYKLVITHPVTGKELVFETDIPKSFINFMYPESR